MTQWFLKNITKYLEYELSVHISEPIYYHLEFTIDDASTKSEDEYVTNSHIVQ